MYYLKKTTKKQFIEAVNVSNSYSNIARELGFGYYNSKMKKDIIKLLDFYDLEINFDRGKLYRKYEIIEKSCPVCGKMFTTQKNHPKEKTTCGISCSNTYFRSGPDNPNWNEDGPASYRSTCFHYHEKKCIICGEEKIVEVHHYDDNHHNHSIGNLVPMCPTHHQYMHSRYREEIEDKVDEYIKEWKIKITENSSAW